MGGKPIGHRGRDKGEWTWRPEEPTAGRPGPWRLAAVAAGLLTLAIALSLALFLSLRSDEGAPVGAPVASPTPTPVTTPTTPPAPVGPRFRLALWGDRRGEWQSGDLRAGASGYGEGDTVPFLLRIDDADPGAVYTVRLRYDCRAGEAAAFDFLAGYRPGAGSDPVLAADGPGQSLPDAAIPIPDDPSTPLDDTTRLFHLWGATFDGQPNGPWPDTPCRGTKLMILHIRAQAETAFLMWGAHLASSQDWGAGRGAASQERPFGIEVDIQGTEEEPQEVRIAPGAVSP